MIKNSHFNIRGQGGILLAFRPARPQCPHCLGSGRAVRPIELSPALCEHGEFSALTEGPCTECNGAGQVRPATHNPGVEAPMSLPLHSVQRARTIALAVSSQAAFPDAAA